MVMDKLQFQDFLKRLPDDLTIFPVKAVGVFESSDGEPKPICTGAVLTIRIHITADTSELRTVNEILKIENLNE